MGIALIQRPELKASYEIMFAPSDFCWNGANAEGLPIIIEPNGTVSEPLLRFFGWSLKSKRANISSMKDEAYTLRDWSIHIRSIGCSHCDVDDETMSRWREIQTSMKNKDSDPIRSEARVKRKLATVFTLYDNLREATLGDFDYVSPLGPITCRERDRISKKSKDTLGSGVERTWLSADKASRSRKRRKTPDGTGVSAVLSRLRQSSSDLGLCDRNWLIGRTMSDCGLRAEEVATFGIRALEQALAQESIKAPHRTLENGGRRVRLDEFDEANGDRELILSGLNRLKRKHNENIYVVVKGKGGKERSAPFSIDYVIDLLENYVWSGRQEALRSANTEDPPDQVFLSRWKAEPLTKGAIGNLVKEAFTKVGIPLSGHRLRAYYATVLADRLWAELYAANGFRWDQTVENMVLDKVAEALGHASADTTVKYYVNIAQLKYFGMSGNGNLRDLRAAARVFAKHHMNLDGAQIRKLLRVVEWVAVGVGDVEELLDSILADPAYAMSEAAVALTAANASPASKSHSLRIVPKTSLV